MVHSRVNACGEIPIREGSWLRTDPGGGNTHNVNSPQPFQGPKPLPAAPGTVACMPASTLPPASADVDVPVKKTRGASKNKNWKPDPDTGMTVIPLELDMTDAQTRRRVEQHFEAGFRLRRGVQAHARAACKAYSAAYIERRTKGPGTVRARLGLTRKQLEQVATQQMDAAGWMRHHLLKANSQNLADQVWNTVERFLYGTAAGKGGVPHVGRWWDFTTMPGRARSHTKESDTWETYQLRGSLDGHLNTYRHPRLPDTITTAGQVLTDVPPGVSVINQPKHLPAPVKPKDGWRTHTGALVMVFTGLGGGDLVAPIRLPSGAGRWTRLHYFLADSSLWHKNDLVRVQDLAAPGGWRYYLHLTVLTGGYTSDSTRARRAQVPVGRTAGVDVNVSNVAIVSAPNNLNKITTGTVRLSRVEFTPEQQRAHERRLRKAAGRAKALDRSRRASNTRQYDLNKKQKARAERRKQAGLPARVVDVPKGARVANKAGVPKRAYRKDTLSDGYRKTRGKQTQEAASAAQARKQTAAQTAATIVAVHGPNLVTEAGSKRGWQALWGKRMAVTTPGMLTAAIATEAKAAGGQLLKAGTRQTAWSQHCPCGHRTKKRLNIRIHACKQCGFTADRDDTSALLGAATMFTDVTDPSTARVDYLRAARIADAITVPSGQQEGRDRSTPGPQPAHTSVRKGNQGSTSSRRNASAGHVETNGTAPTQTHTHGVGRRGNIPHTPTPVEAFLHDAG